MVPFRAEHLARLGGRHWIAPEVAQAMEGKLAVTGMVGDRVVACAGALELWAGRFVMWAHFAKGVKPWKSIHRAAKNFVRVVAQDARRVEVEVPTTYEVGRRWAERLGFTLEPGVRRKYLPDGSDAVVYVIVKEG